MRLILRLSSCVLVLAASLVPAVLSAQNALNYDPYTFTTLAGRSNTGSEDGPATAAQFTRPFGVVCDASGNTYVADTGNHTIRMIAGDGTVSTIAGAAGIAGSQDGTGAAARFRNPGGIAQDAAGNIFVADTENHVIRRITPGRVVTTLAGLAGTPGVSDGTGSAARFFGPMGLLLSSDGQVLYVSDSTTSTIRKVETATGKTTTVAGTGIMPSADYVEGSGASARFNRPLGTAVDSGGNTYVTDSTNHVIRKVTPAGVTSLFAGSPGVDGATDSADGTALLSTPDGIAIDSSGNLFVTDVTAHTIRKITPAGVVSTVAGSAYLSGAVDGTGANARFASPVGIAVDSSGNVFVSDSNNYAIRKITSAGVVTTFAGQLGTSNSTDGNGPNARFVHPLGLAIDSAGNLFVCDAGMNAIRKITASADTSTIAGGVFSSYADGTGPLAGFTTPNGITVSSTGDLYVTEAGNHTIRKVTSAGVATTVAGTPAVAGSSDGNGTSASFNQPAGITFDRSGNLIVADTLNNMVRKVTLAGVVTTIAGAASGTGYKDATGSDARFAAPLGLAFDSSSGLLLVADSDNNSIRSVDLRDGTVKTFAGNGNENSNLSRNGDISTIARFNKPTAVVSDGEVIYVLEAVGKSGAGNHDIRKISWDTVDTTLRVASTLAGTTNVRGMVDGGLGVGRLNNPWGFALGPNHVLVVADTSNNAIRKVNTTDGTISLLAGGGLAASKGAADGTAAARFNEPNGIAIAGDGTLYIADTYSATIRSINPTTGAVSLLAGTPGVPKNSNVAGTESNFVLPVDLAVGKDGYLLVADPTDQTIRKVQLSDHSVSTFAGRPGQTGTPATDLSLLNVPASIVFDSTNDVYYVACSGDNTIRKLNKDGSMALLAGSIDGLGGSVDNTSYNARFSSPLGVTVDIGGNVYVADTGNHAIRKITPDGVVTTIAGSSRNAGSRDGVGATAWFNSPNRLAASPDSKFLFVSDTGNDTIRKIWLQADGSNSQFTVKTIAGSPNRIGGVDSSGAAALFNIPLGLAVDSSGALYVADSLNNTIRKGVAGGAANYSPTSGSNATTRSAAALPVGNDPASNGHSPAPITPTPPIIAGKPSGDRLINISTRSMVGTDANVQIAGFVISGATPKQVIIRASGPSLASSFNLTGVLADPMIELHNSATGAVLATNDDWDSALDTAFAAVGAFPWAVGSKDSALAASLAPGMYTVVVKGKNNGTGIALVEVYDADASATAPKLINISTRSFVGTGDNVQIAGFVVGGNVAKKVVIRAAGPALASNFGISGALANPVLELHSQGMDTPLADVENWDASLASDFAAVGAFPWTAGSKDAALVTTLNPGPYTVVVKGKNDGTGVALVEVYEESN